MINANSLPSSFMHRMREMLGDEEADALYASYQETKTQGLRINPLKVSQEVFLSVSPFSLKRVPWCRTGYYYN